MTAIATAPDRRRTGFTLVELVAVAGVVALLVGLLLPAVNAAREAARRAGCVNNLHQLAAGVLHYETVHGCLPPGSVSETRPLVSLPNAGHHASWIAQILPAIDQVPLADALNFDLSVYHPSNSTVYATSLELLHCPSVLPPAGPDSDYAGSAHDVEAPVDVTNNGVLFLNRALRVDEISDGTSHTILIGEKTADDPARLPWVAGTRGVLGHLSGFSPSSGSPPPPAAAPGTYVGPFEGPHPGGVNTANADGSVRFVKSTITPSIARRLANRRDGRLLDANEY